MSILGPNLIWHRGPRSEPIHPGLCSTSPRIELLPSPVPWFVKTLSRHVKTETTWNSFENSFYHISNLINLINLQHSNDFLSYLCDSMHITACLSSCMSLIFISQPIPTFHNFPNGFNMVQRSPNVPPWSIWSHHVPPAAGHSPVYISSSMSPGASSACAPLPDGVSTVGRRLQGDVSKVSNSEIIVWLVRSL